MQSVIIDQEFKNLIPPQSPEEHSGLEAMIVAEGCREPLIVWTDGTLVDGHNRYEICTRLNLTYKTVEKEFEGRRAIRVWIRNNQLSRRNLSDAWKLELALGNKADLLDQGREKYQETVGRPKKESLSINDNDLFEPDPELDVIVENLKTGIREINDKSEDPLTETEIQTGVAKIIIEEKLKIINTPEPEPKHNTRNEIAASVGFSTGKVAQAEYVKANAPEVWEKAKTGELSVGGAYKEVKKAEKIEVRKQLIEDTREKINTEEVQKPTGLFDVIVIDPPWNYGRVYDPETSRVANPYPEMNQSQLLDLEIPHKGDSVMYLWTTHAFLFDAKQLLDSWGYTYKATLVWNKQKMGMGAWLRMQCEFVLLGIKGKPFYDNTKWRDVINEPRREHSRKPDVFYDMVNDVTAGRKLDFFSREEREGWHTYGAEAGKFLE